MWYCWTNTYYAPRNLHTFVSFKGENLDDIEIEDFPVKGRRNEGAQESPDLADDEKQDGKVPFAWTISFTIFRTTIYVFDCWLLQGHFDYRNIGPKLVFKNNLKQYLVNLPSDICPTDRAPMRSTKSLLVT